MSSPDRIAELRQVARETLAEGRQMQAEARWEKSIAYNAALLQIISPLVIAGINEEGLDQRMKNEYRKAEKLFKCAKQLGFFSHDLIGEIIAEVGLMDLSRTAAENDPRYSRGKEVDLIMAGVHRKRVERIYGKMAPGWNIGKVNAEINYGLLDHELGRDGQAIKEYTQAEIGCKFLLATEPEGVYGPSDYMNRLARATHLKGIALDTLGEVNEETINGLEEVLDTYTRLDDVRGQQNCAVTLGDIYKKTGDATQAAFWYKKSIEFSQREENGVMVVVDPVQKQFAEDRLAGLNPQ